MLAQGVAQNKYMLISVRHCFQALRFDSGGGEVCFPLSA